MKSTSDELYGSGFMVNNVHAFLHIADDANTYDSSNFSVFLFEHCLASIKLLVSSGKERLKQIAKRLEEKDYARKEKAQPSAAISCIYLSNYYVNKGILSVKSIRKAGISRYVCKVYMQPDDLFAQPLTSRSVGIYRLQSKQNQNGNQISV